MVSVLILCNAIPKKNNIILILPQDLVQKPMLMAFLINAKFLLGRQE